MFEVETFINHHKRQLRVRFVYENEGAKDLRKDIKIINMFDLKRGIEYKGNSKSRRAIKEKILKKLNLI